MNSIVQWNIKLKDPSVSTSSNQSTSYFFPHNKMITPVMANTKGAIKQQQGKGTLG
jgi:hypothetical protein